jgi:hypothetical protein
MTSAVRNRRGIFGSSGRGRIARWEKKKTLRRVQIRDAEDPEMIACMAAPICFSITLLRGVRTNVLCEEEER